jgi:hypothetical protein
MDWLTPSQTLKTLQFNNTRYEKISTYYENTFEWLWKKPEYCAWYYFERSNLLFIEGKPDSRKSTLVRYFQSIFHENCRKVLL